MKEMHGWMAKKESVRIVETESYVISCTGLVFGKDIYIIIYSSYTVFDQDSALEKI